jgi:phosphosulfolactate phosphohydrolase-like enzyme
MATRARQTVLIDALPDSVYRHLDCAIVCIDVLLSTTTAVTSVAQGRRTLFASSVADGRRRARDLSDPVLAGEPGFAAADFDSRSGPSALEGRVDVGRPLVLVSPAAQLLYNAEEAAAVYVACLRNMSATADLLAERYERVALLGAGFGGESRCEDQMVAAWIAGKLVDRGFETADPQTARELERWSRTDVSVAALGRGAEYLRRVGREEDLRFVLSRVDDLDLTCRFRSGETERAHVFGHLSLVSH